MAIVLLTTQFGSVFPLLRVADYQIGSVAERDFLVERDILYLDEEATRLKREAAGKLVLPIFRVNERIGEERLQRFSEFRERLLALSREESALDTVFLRLQVDFPGILSTITDSAPKASPRSSERLATWLIFIPGSG